MGDILFYTFFFGIPAVALIWFVISLITFCRTDKSSSERKPRKALLIVSGCVAGVLVLALISFAILSMLVIMNM